MRQLIILLVIILIACKISYSESIDSIKITFHSDILKNNQIKLGYYYGSKTFLKDIIHINNYGEGTYLNKVHKGIYFIVLPDSSVHEIMIDNEQELIINIVAADNQIYCYTKGNPIAEAYDTYLKKMAEIYDKADSTNQVKLNPTVKIIDNRNSRLTSEQKSEIISLQKSSAKIYPGSLLEIYLNSLIPIEISNIKKLYPQDSSSMLNTLNLYRLHYLDNVNMNDERIIYTPVFSEKINTYLDKIISQQPDTVAQEIEKIYNSIQNQPVKRFFIESQFDKYRSNNGKANQEYIYYKIVNNIYLAGRAPWENETRLQQLKADMERLKPVLLNQIAPEINLPGIANTNNPLSAIKSEHTLVIFWDIDCPLCLRIIKDINKTVSSYNYISIHVYTICLNSDFEKWSSLMLKSFPTTWTNTIQLTLHGPSEIYNISKTPTIILLDRNKKIIYKNITNAELDKILLKIASAKSSN